jgi:hypothetical protein
MNAILIPESEGLMRVLVNRKGSIVLREVPFGLEGLERFIIKDTFKENTRKCFWSVSVGKQRCCPKI